MHSQALAIVAFEYRNRFVAVLPPPRFRGRARASRIVLDEQIPHVFEQKQLALPVQCAVVAVHGLRVDVVAEDCSACVSRIAPGIVAVA